MQITHEEARKLIQLDLDQALDLQGSTTLYAHLKDCLHCRVYADQIKEVEELLSPALKRHWNVRPIPLSIRALMEKSNRKIQAGTLLTIRTVVLALIFVGFVFSTWQFILSNTATATPVLAGVPPVPTPSAYSTSTRIMPATCVMITYSVRRNDTLASIAQQFAVTKEEIIALNGLKTETLDTAMKLSIPTCDFTPTSTLNPATLTTTYTPSHRPTISTPGG